MSIYQTFHSNVAPIYNQRHRWYEIENGGSSKAVLTVLKANQ
jgi:hypothetical protein